MKNVVITKSKALLAMLRFLNKKQAMGEDLLKAYETLTPLQQAALRTRNVVIKENFPWRMGFGISNRQ